MADSIRQLSEAYIARRGRLHRRYAELSKLPDASRLAYLCGPEHVWSEEEVAALWRQADGTGAGIETPQNNVYLHVPFCKSICSFCNYERLRPSSPHMLQAWETRLFESVERLGAATDHLEFHSLYVGGGTPSVLPPDQLKRVFTRLREAFHWHPRASRHFEFDPAVMNRKKLEVLVNHGFSHFSFGIQTLRSDINAAHNRGPQNIEMVEKRFTEFHDQKLTRISCDFLAGLAGTRPEDILAEINTVVSRFRPIWVDVFMITPTAEYIDGHFDGSYPAFFEHLQPFQQQIPEGLDRIARAHNYDYQPGQGHHLNLQRRDVQKPKASNEVDFGYCQLVSESHRPLNLLGLGPSARSQIFGLASFQNRNPSNDPLVPGPPVYAGHRRSMATEAQAYLAHGLRDTDSIDRMEFQRIFGADVTEVLPVALRAWLNEQVACIEPKQVKLISQDRQNRTKQLLWMVPEEHLEHELAQHMALDLSPAGLASLLHPLPLGIRLAGNVVLESVEHATLRLRIPNDATRKVRVSPGLSPKGAPQLLPYSLPANDESKQQMLGALRQLQRLISRNHKPWVPAD